jgi:23S rRNA (adenine-N6)-dimethyltransferase
MELRHSGVDVLNQRKIEHSQNFIRHPKLVRQLLELSNINPTDLVIEIGPGKGMITRELVKTAGRVIAIERDRRFSEELSEINNGGNFQLVIDDFMKWQLPREDYKVFSNIPFNYTSDIVSKLTTSDRKPTDIYLLMQESAAHRFIGMPHEKNSQISILLSIEFSIEVIQKINRDYFKPRPNVSIVFVHLAKRTTPLLPKTNLQDFRDFVVYGYNQWSPTIIDAFREVFTNRQRIIITRSMNLAGLKPSDITTEQWIELYNAYSKFVGEDKKNLVRRSEKRLKRNQSKLTKQYRTRKPY